MLKKLNLNNQALNFNFSRNLTKHFSFIGKIKRHFDNYLEPGHIEQTSNLQDTNLSMYTNMRQFQAYIGKNAYDMAIHNEYDLWPHSNFGTIDNPLLIFSAGTTWRYF